jgi:hypothetical protein
LNHPLALIDLLAQHLAQVARLCSKDVLPNRLVTQKGHGICDELPCAPQLFANCGDEDCRAARKRKQFVYGLQSLSGQRLIWFVPHSVALDLGYRCPDRRSKPSATRTNLPGWGNDAE